MININGNKICAGSVYVIAEISANHNGDIKEAYKLIEKAYESGADAVKLQTYTADTLTLDCKSDIFKINHGTSWDGEYFYDLYKKAYTPWQWHKELKDFADTIGITLFSTPFDRSAVDFLEDINCAAYKIASFEAIDTELIKYTASKGKPIIISTGISYKNEIDDAVKACKDVGNENIILLKCTSSYPAKPEDMNLLTIKQMQQDYDLPIGLSDHTLGIEVPIVAVSLGACVVEKHFTLDRSLGGVDSHFSLEPYEFKEMVNSIRNTEKILGNAFYGLDDKNIKNRRFARSLFISENVKKGEVLNEKNIRSVRPGDGLHPKHYNNVLGKKFNKDLNKGTPLAFEDFE